VAQECSKASFAVVVAFWHLLRVSCSIPISTSFRNVAIPLFVCIEIVSCDVSSRVVPIVFVSLSQRSSA
jgi:hypothetical protein